MEIDLLKKGAQLARRPSSNNYYRRFLHRARMPNHEAGTFDLLLPRAPQRGVTIATENVVDAQYIGDE